jgi:hypothetical protein
MTRKTKIRSHAGVQAEFFDRLERRGVEVAAPDTQCKFDFNLGWYGSVSIATRYGPAGRSRDRISVEARFFALVQTGCGVQPASCPMGSGSLPGVKRPGHRPNHPPPCSVEVKERVKLYLYSRLRLHGRLWVELYLSSP